MGAGEFERVLVEKLRLGGPPPSGQSRPAPSFSHAIWGSFRTAPLLGWPPADVAPRPRRTCVPEPRSKAPRRLRPLGPAEHAALEHLRSAGAAALGDDFTAADLKRAFRALALRYHPDRHPAGSSAQHRELARTFARVHESYRTLLGACTRVH
jgi:hypothetical protein